MKRMVFSDASDKRLDWMQPKRQSSVNPLNAPGGTAAAVTQQLEQGNRDFAAQNWTDAKTSYLTAIERAPALAEAHYNLALTLERLGDKG